MSDSKTTYSSEGSHLYFQASGILLAAITLGFAYNHSSPLGVRASSAAERATAAVVVPSENAPLPPPLFRTGYVNQTLAMTLESTTSNLAPAQPATTATRPPAVVPSSFPALTWPQVKPLVAAKQIVLLDARLKANFDSSHIPGAISLPATTPAAELQTFATQYPKGTHFVVYCGSSSCHMSRALGDNLVKICGFTNVSEMPGGFSEYLIAESGAAKTP